MDNKERLSNIYEFYELGFDTVIPVSGEHNIGFREVLDTITKDITNSDTLKIILLNFVLLADPMLVSQA